MTTINKANRTVVFSRLFGYVFSRLRDYLAHRLIKWGIHPDTLTVIGLLLTLAAGVFLALGAGDKVGPPGKIKHSWYGLAAGLILILAAACDILDGAVARNNGQTTRRGGLLDSCLDRIADGAIFAGILLYYLLRPDLAHSRVFAVLSAAALFNAELISYIKARAENYIPDCQVGYWQRPERITAILLGLFIGHTATVIALLAVLPAFTALRRLSFALRQIDRLEQNRPTLDPKAPPQGLARLALWLYPRGTWQYELTSALLIILIGAIDLQNL